MNEEELGEPEGESVPPMSLAPVSEPAVRVGDTVLCRLGIGVDAPAIVVAVYADDVVDLVLFHDPRALVSAVSRGHSSSFQGRVSRARSLDVDGWRAR